MTNILRVAFISILCLLGICSCTAEAHVPVSSEALAYFKDARVDPPLCYVVYLNGRSNGIATVPCERVEGLITKTITR